VVSPDRRFVRIGFSGAVFVRHPIYVPFQFIVPSVFYGPGPGNFTVGQPEKVVTVWVPF
jgi:hypothetical protein